MMPPSIPHAVGRPSLAVRAGRPSILVTGFGPFPGMADNPTSRLVGALIADPPAGVVAEILPTCWTTSAGLAERVRAFDAVIMFGVAGRSHRIRYERLALPRAAPFPDASGALPEASPLASRRSAFDVSALVRRARTAGFPVVLSSSAGTYICNATYAAALDANPRTLFVHVPRTTPRGPLSDAGLARHAAWLIAEVARACPPRRRPPIPPPAPRSGIPRQARCG